MTSSSESFDMPFKKDAEAKRHETHEANHFCRNRSDRGAVTSYAAAYAGTRTHYLADTPAYVGARLEPKPAHFIHHGAFQKDSIAS
jgi:hypothetical protein